MIRGNNAKRLDIVRIPAAAEFVIILAETSWRLWYVPVSVGLGHRNNGRRRAVSVCTTIVRKVERVSIAWGLLLDLCHNHRCHWTYRKYRSHPW